ncbi:MAG: sulfotransferase family 2 domain-containing protein [Henriciella sp.]
MPVEIKNTDLVYIPSPKVATTSLKYFLFEVNEGQKFDDVHGDNKATHIHNHADGFGAVLFSKLDMQALAGKRRISVIRDPLDRLISCYKNRVVALKAYLPTGSISVW